MEDSTKVTGGCLVLLVVIFLLAMMLMSSCRGKSPGATPDRRYVGNGVYVILIDEHEYLQMVDYAGFLLHKENCNNTIHTK